MSAQLLAFPSKPDIMKETIQRFDPKLLDLLLQDKTSKKHILWATTDYESLGYGYGEKCEILPEFITGDNTLLIQPRSAKSKEEQIARTRDKAEVFTPSWVCNCQNNLIDTEWFNRKDVFNTEVQEGWVVNAQRIDFTGSHKGWKQYVDAQRLEVTCGEAPYLVSRYDTVTGKSIPLFHRIGLFDRKMRVVHENANSDQEWLIWSIRALQSIFGFEYQGDNVLLARENILLSYIDYYREKNQKEPPPSLLRTIANIISWNIWQMDGMKYVIPGSCHDATAEQFDLLGESISTEPCPGCKYDKPFSHNGIYCILRDWRSKRTIRFVDMMKGWK